MALSTGAKKKKRNGKRQIINKLSDRRKRMRLIPKMWTYAEYASHRRPSTTIYDSIIMSDTFLYVPFPCGADFMLLCETATSIVLTFAGTKGLKGWASNFDPFPLESRGTIHNGMYDAWKPFKIKLDRFFEDAVEGAKKGDWSGVEKEIYVTGHSRGGALASLCCRHIAKNRKCANTCVTFGAPAHGTAEYVSEYNKLACTHLRIVNGYDIVARNKTIEKVFTHLPLLLRLKQRWWHGLFFRVRDHYYSSYTKALIKYCRKDKDVEGERQMQLVLDRCLI